MPSPTPGEMAYQAWWQRFSDGTQAPPLHEAWAQVSPQAQQAWEAAAQAVLAMQEEETRCAGPISSG